MEISANEYVALLQKPLVRTLYATERSVIDKYMSDLTEDSAVIDMACGLGYATNHVNIHYGCRVLGVDIMPDMIKHAQKMYGNAKAEFIVGDVCDPELLDGRKESFHWIMCHLSLQLFKNTEAFLQNCFKLLKENGKLLVVYTTREFGDSIDNSSIRKTLEDPKWQSQLDSMESMLDIPLFHSNPEEKYPWITNRENLLQLLQEMGFSITATEMFKDLPVLSLNPENTSAYLGAFKQLPEEHREEFIDDIIKAARTLSGEEEPKVNINLVAVVAKKEERL